MPSERPADAAPNIEIAKLRSIRPRELVIRFIFGTAISVAAGVLGTTIGPRFGGAFLAFPAILPASLTLIQNKEGTRRADRNAIGAVLGGVALVVFAIAGEASFTHLAPILALGLSATGWTAAAIGLYALLAVLQPDACDAQQD